MSENQTEPDLDYKGMYKQLSKEKREYKDQLSAVVLSSTNLEALVRARAFKKESFESKTIRG